MSGLKKLILPLIALAAVIYFIAFHWGRFVADFWPIDHSNVGPNLVASVVQWAVILIAVALLYPPVRRAIERFAKRHVSDLKQHISAEHDALHEKLDHLIAHHSNAAGRDFTATKERPK